MELGGMLKWLLSAGGAALLAVFGPPFAVALAGLIALMMLDTLLALVANGRIGKVDPAVGYLGWRRKAATVLVLLCLAIIYAMAQYLAVPDLDRYPLPTAVVLAFALVELLSVLRNARLCGATLPLLDTMFGQLEAGARPLPPEEERR